jgi:hypothetical protein
MIRLLSALLTIVARVCDHFVYREHPSREFMRYGRGS